MHKQLLTDFNPVCYESSKKNIHNNIIVCDNWWKYGANIQGQYTNFLNSYLLYTIKSTLHTYFRCIGPLLWIICLCIKTVKATEKPFYKVKLRRRINRIPIYESTFSQLNLGRILTIYHADKVLTSFRLSNRRHRQLMKRKKPNGIDF